MLKYEEQNVIVLHILESFLCITVFNTEEADSHGLVNKQ
jgi:hypothetical protein